MTDSPPAPIVAPQSAGIYLHIPFCKQACYYCNFHFSTSTRYKVAMLEAIKQELTLRQSYLKGAKIATIYFGGGTPSLLAIEEVASLLQHIQNLFECGQKMEVTLEANPDDLTLDYLIGLKEAGINRLSIGIQSFDEKVLTSLNRAHSAQEAVASVRHARKAGFPDLSIDLMYGLPARREGDWEEELKEALHLGPTHISAYCLTIEPNTVFGHRKAEGRFIPLSEAQEIAEFTTLYTTLARHGYLHYEIANFCLPDHYAKHNTHYWQRVPYLGVGPSAHSYDGKSRQYNLAHNKHYIEALAQGKLPCRKEVLRLHEVINEYIMLGLRTMWGVDIEYLRRYHGFDLLKAKSSEIELAIEKKLLRKDGKCLLLTLEGKLLADEIAGKLFLT